MDITLNFALWVLVLAAATAMMAIDLLVAGRTSDGRSGSATIAVLLAQTALLLFLVNSVDAKAVYVFSPFALYLVQYLLPTLAALLGGWLAARAFIDAGERSRSQHTSIHGPVSMAALLLATGAGILVSPGEFSAALSATVLVVVGASWQLVSVATPSLLRRLILAIALCLLWSGAFLVYLLAFPEQIAVGYESPDGAALADSHASEWIIPLILLVAVIVGFAKKRRG